jgi:hypothetical protein
MLSVYVSVSQWFRHFLPKTRSCKPISQNKTRITVSFLVIFGEMATSILLLRYNIKTPLPLLIFVALDLFHTELYSSKNVQSSNQTKTSTKHWHSSCPSHAKLLLRVIRSCTLSFPHTVPLAA